MAAGERRGSALGCPAHPKTTLPVPHRRLWKCRAPQLLLPSLTGTEIRLPDERPAVLRHGVCQRRRGGSLKPRQFIPQSPLSACLGRQSTWLSSLPALCSPPLRSVSQRGHYMREATIQGRKRDPRGPSSSLLPEELRTPQHLQPSLPPLPPTLGTRVWLCFFAFLMRGERSQRRSPSRR